VSNILDVLSYKLLYYNIVVSMVSVLKKKIKPLPESDVPLLQRDTDEIVESQNLILVSTYSNTNFIIPIIINFQLIFSTYFT